MNAIPSTANVADACLSTGATFAVWPDLRPAAAPRLHGPAVPVRHLGSVDVFLAAIDRATPGAILMVDNEGRRDEGCIGDLIVREAQLAGLGGIVIWGCHRDSADLREIDFPVFSQGAFPVGPREIRPAVAHGEDWARFEDTIVTSSHMVIADQDGVMALDAADWEGVCREAIAIRDREADQAKMVEAGLSLRSQFRFDDYVRLSASDSSYTFRKHLRLAGAEIER